MYSKSNINITLHKKKRANFIKKIQVYFIFIIFLILLLICVLNIKKIQIKEIKVSGNFSVPTEDIIRLANTEINKKYFFIILVNNIFLLRRQEIEKQILENIKEINKIKILIRGIDKIEIIVQEREVKNLWCKGIPINIGPKDCYFMDLNGFIFEKAPQFSKDIFFEYFGLIKEKNPIGQFYLKEDFKNISNLFNILKKMSFEIKSFYAVDENEYEIYILGGGKIIMNNKRSFESQLINLQALISNEYIKTDIESLKKIKYIDLRFGNKVNFI
ncbi:MAG: FtsQ-type POTRA domain-containing protein [bacterium]